MSLRLPLAIAALVVAWSCANGAVLAQPLNQAFPAVNGEAGIMQAAAHRTADKPAGIAPDPSFFSRWLQGVVARDATPGGIEEAWRARKAAVVDAIRTLTPEKRAEIAVGLDSLLRAMTAYAFDRDHLRQAFTDCRETLAAYEKQGGLHARSAWEADQDLVQRMKRLGLDRNGLALADDLWMTGGQPMLRAAVRVAGELRRELAIEAPAIDRAIDAVR